MKTFTFPKAEHLCLRSDVEALFSPGSVSQTVFPLRATFRLVPYGGSGPRVQVLLSVSKRRLRHAVDRNRAKRQLREAYRLQKHLLLPAVPDGQALHVAFVWLHGRTVAQDQVFGRMHTLLQHMAERIAKSRSIPIQS